MNDFVLSIFPRDAAMTVTTTVWVGVMVVVFMNLRLGWTLSGLVVPGYLVPLLLSKPISAGVVCVEAVLTYWIVHFISERANRLPAWSSLFGRDRFFAIVLVSVLVRALLDGWLLPWLGSQANERFGIVVDYRVDLHSYGLIVVALMANYFWKPGLMRGLLPMTATIGVTYLIVRYLLIEFTNFNVGSLQYVYEDIATSLLASPKAYIVLLITAYLASWMNFRYGWEFNGILIPALLALLWHEPWKIAASMAEGLVVLLLATLVLKLPLLRRTTVEGGRKIMFFFSICFLYRLLLAYVTPAMFPSYQVTDAYGFGYLLATLLAVKAHDRHLTIRLAHATISVSVCGAVMGSLIGFLLTQLPHHWFEAAGSTAVQESPLSLHLRSDLADIVRSDKVVLYQKHASDSYQRPTADDLQRFARGVRMLKSFARDRRPQQLSEARSVLHQVNYSVRIVQERFLYLRERSPARGWGIYVLNLRQPDGLLFEVPAPMDEWATLEAGTYLFRELEGGCLAVAGARRHNSTTGAADVLSRLDTIFAAFHQEMCRDNVIQVRGPADSALSSVHSGLWIKGSLPVGLKLAGLKILLPTYDIHWSATSRHNILRDDAWSGFGELLLSRSDRRTLLARLAIHEGNEDGADPLKYNHGYLHHWLLSTKSRIARRGTNEYRPPRLEELLFLDEEVLRPMLNVSRHASSWSEMKKEHLLELRAAAAAAAVFDYQVVMFHDESSGQDFLCLVEWEPRRRHWGTFVLRCRQPRPYVIEVPRPIYEINAFEFGLSLFQRHEASALLLAGAHPRANADSDSDVTRLSNRMNVFNLFHQILLRELGSRPLLIVQSRAIRAPVDADVVIATDDGQSNFAKLSPLKRSLVDQLDQDGMRLRFVDGSPLIAGYELANVSQAATLNLGQNKELITLWLSPSLRTKFRQSTENQLLTAQFETVGIPTVEADLFSYLEARGGTPSVVSVSDDMRKSVQQYLHNYDIVVLRQLTKRWSRSRLTRVVDRNSGQSFLLMAGPSEAVPCVVNLTGWIGDAQRTEALAELTRDGVQRFVDSRAAWLSVGSAP